MSKPSIFTAALASGNKINVYDTRTGSIFKIITLPYNTTVISGPVVFSDGFSVTLKEGNGTYMVTYGLPLCSIKTKTFISGV